MTIEQIKGLDVGSLAGPDCVLWLWTTNAHMREAFNVLDAWGFTFKTILTWVKHTMGLGDWLRGQNRALPDGGTRQANHSAHQSDDP